MVVLNEFPDAVDAEIVTGQVEVDLNATTCFAITEQTDGFLTTANEVTNVD